MLGCGKHSVLLLQASSTSLVGARLRSYVVRVFRKAVRESGVEERTLWLARLDSYEPLPTPLSKGISVLFPERGDVRDFVEFSHNVAQPETIARQWRWVLVRDALALLRLATRWTFFLACARPAPHVACECWWVGLVGGCW